jgi:hypothetical protein
MNSRQRISDFQQLVNTKSVEIRQEGDAAWAPINLNQTEPRIVYSFLSGTSGGVGHLNRTLAPLLSVNARTVKFAGIFLHQKPIVKGLRATGKSSITVGRACELGDLHLLFLYVSKNKSLCQCRSTIFQAKLKPSTNGPVISHPDQRRLYDKCPGFRYETVLAGEERNLPWGRAERERALQYLFIGQRPVQTRLIPSDQGQGAFFDFGELIFRFLSDSTGFGVTTKPSKGKNWSRIVWDQIDNVAKTQFGHYGDRNAALQKLLNRFNSFDDPKEFFCGDGPDGPIGQEAANQPSGGVPLLMVIVSDKELNDLSELSTNMETEPNPPTTGGPAIQEYLAAVKHAAPMPRGRFETYLTSDLTEKLQFVTNQNDYESILDEFVRRADQMDLTQADAKLILAVIENGNFLESPRSQMLATEIKLRLHHTIGPVDNDLEIEL